jgi:hypothetical protein
LQKRDRDLTVATSSNSARIAIQIVPMPWPLACDNLRANGVVDAGAAEAAASDSKSSSSSALGIVLARQHQGAFHRIGDARAVGTERRGPEVLIRLLADSAVQDDFAFPFSYDRTVDEMLARGIECRERDAAEALRFDAIDDGVPLSARFGKVCETDSIPAEHKRGEIVVCRAGLRRHGCQRQNFC